MIRHFLVTAGLALLLAAVLAPAAPAIELPPPPRDPAAGLPGLEGLLVALESEGRPPAPPGGAVTTWGRWTLRLQRRVWPGPRPAPGDWIADVGPITSATCREIVEGDLPVGTRQIVAFRQGDPLAVGGWPVAERFGAIDAICGTQEILPRLRLIVSRRPYLGLGGG